MTSSEMTKAAGLFAAIANTKAVGRNQPLSTLLETGGAYTPAETFERALANYQRGMTFLQRKKIVRRTEQGRMIVSTAQIEKQISGERSANTTRDIGRLYARVVADLAPHVATLEREGFRGFAAVLKDEHIDTLAYRRSRARFEALRGDAAPDRESLEKATRAAAAAVKAGDSGIRLRDPSRLDALKQSFLDAGVDLDANARPTLPRDRDTLETIFANAAALSRDVSISKEAPKSDPSVRAYMDLRIAANTAVMKPRTVLAKEEARPVFGPSQPRQRAEVEPAVPDRASLERMVLTASGSLKALRASPREMKGVTGYDGDRLDLLEERLQHALRDKEATASTIRGLSREQLAPVFDAAKSLVRPLRTDDRVEADNPGTAVLLDMRLQLGATHWIPASEARELELGEERKAPPRDDLQMDDRGTITRAMVTALELVEDGRFSLSDMDGSVSVDGSKLSSLKSRVAALHQMGVVRRLANTRQVLDKQSGALKTVPDFRAPDISRADAELLRTAFGAMSEVVKGDGRLAYDAGTPDESYESDEETKEVSEADLAEVDAIFGPETGAARDLSADADDRSEEEDRAAPKISESADLNTVAASYDKVKRFESEQRGREASKAKLRDLAPAFDRLVDEDRYVDIDKESYEQMLDAVHKLRDRGTLERIAENSEIQDPRLVAIEAREQPQFGSLEEAMSQGAETEPHYLGEEDRRAVRSAFDNVHTHRTVGDLSAGLPEARGVLSEKDFARLSAKERSFAHAVRLGGGAGPLGDYTHTSGEVALDRVIDFVEGRQFARDENGRVRRDASGNAVRDKHFVDTMRRAAHPDRTIVAPTLHEGVALRAVANGYVNRMEAERAAKEQAKMRSSEVVRVGISAEDARRLTETAAKEGRELVDLHVHQGGAVTLDNGVTAPVSTRADYPTPEIGERLERSAKNRSKIDLVKTEVIRGALESGANKINLVLDGQKVIGAYGETNEDRQKQRPKARQFEDVVLS